MIYDDSKTNLIYENSYDIFMNCVNIVNMTKYITVRVNVETIFTCVISRITSKFVMHCN